MSCILSKIKVSLNSEEEEGRGKKREKKTEEKEVVWFPISADDSVSQ